MFGAELLRMLVRGIYNISIPFTLYALEEQRGFAGHDVLGPLIVFTTEAAASIGMIGIGCLAAIDRPRMVRTVLSFVALGWFVYLIQRDTLPKGSDIVVWTLVSAFGCLTGIALTFLPPIKKVVTFEEDQRRKEDEANEREGRQALGYYLEHYRIKILQDMKERGVSQKEIDRITRTMEGNKAPETREHSMPEDKLE
jgi:hypothetical protein